MNRTLLDRVRCLLSLSGLSKKFWGEAITTAAYLVNRSPSVPLKGKCPESVFRGKPVDLSHLRVFGCSAFMHSKTDKLDPRSRKCVFLGYPEGVKGYKVWLRDEPGFKVTISRDVIFNESEFPCLIDNTIPLASGTSNEVESASNEVESTSTEVEVPVPFDFVQSDNVLQDISGTEHQNTDPQSDSDETHEATENILSDSVVVPNDYLLTRDRGKRIRKPPKRYGDELNLLALAFNVHESDGDEPQSYKQALKSMFYPKWLIAMEDEMKSLILNKTWILVPKPKDCTVVECRWLFKLKQELNGLRYKVRLVAKGFTQQEGVDYTEIFAPVVKFTTVRFMLALCAFFDWDLKQMDVKTAFLHGDLDKPIYMSQPEGFVDPKYPDHVCLLKKALYGLKQSPRRWNIKFDQCMQSLGFARSSFDHCLYFKDLHSSPVFLLLYVDDMLIMSPSSSAIKYVQDMLSTNFDMKDMGDA